MIIFQQYFVSAPLSFERLSLTHNNNNHCFKDNYNDRDSAKVLFKQFLSCSHAPTMQPSPLRQVAFYLDSRETKARGTSLEQAISEESMNHAGRLQFELQRALLPAHALLIFIVISWLSLGSPRMLKITCVLQQHYLGSMINDANADAVRDHKSPQPILNS